MSNREFVLPEPEIDEVRQKIIERLEAYVEGQLCTDSQKRDLIAAYLSGMVSALDMVSIKKGRKFILLPAVLQKKVIEFAKGLGLQFEERKDD